MVRFLLHCSFCLGEQHTQYFVQIGVIRTANCFRICPTSSRGATRADCADYPITWGLSRLVDGRNRYNSSVLSR